MNRHRRVTLLATATLCAAALASGIERPEAHAQSAAVSIQNFAFQPGTLTVPVGATVTWTNQDDYSHSATSDTGAFDTGILSTGGTGHVTFTTAGSFPYHCEIHPYMHGTIVVGSSTPPTSTPVPTIAPIPTSTPLPTFTPVPTSAGPTATATSAPAGVPTSTSTATPPPAPTSTATPLPTDTATSAPAKSAKLRVGVSPNTISAGKAATVLITVKRSSNGRAVSGAAVTLNGRAVGIASAMRARTDSHGKATLRRVTPRRRGSITLTVTRSGFATAHAHIKVH